MPPSPFSALPPLHISDASPKAISGRTSYLRVRLEFLRYPQLIPCFFNSNVVRSSTKFYPRFNLAMDRSPGFGSTSLDSLALFRLGFPSAPYLKYLTLLHTVTRWLVLQKARHHPHKGLWPVVGTRFQVLFHSPPGVLFNFPSRYFFTIGYQLVFSLTEWSPLIHTRFHVPRTTLDTTLSIRFSYTGLSPSMVCFPKQFY